MQNTRRLYGFVIVVICFALVNGEALGHEGRVKKNLEE